MKVLYFIDSYERWVITLEGIDGMLRYGREHGQEFVIEVVAVAISVMGIIRNVAQLSGWYDTMMSLSERGVTFSACRDALMKFNSEGALLCEFASVVTSGVTEASRRQIEGYALIKL